MKIEHNEDYANDRKKIPSIIVASDVGYVMPLTTTLRSIIDNNSNAWPVTIYILHDGISESERRKVENSLPPLSSSFHWIGIDLAAFAKFKTLPAISKMTFARFMLPCVLPTTIEKVLYLDSDILVMGSLHGLNNIELGDKPLAAVRDHIDSCLSSPSTIAAGVPRVASYFNAGVLLINVPAWRRHRISERAIEFLIANPSTPFADQDALNVAADGLWVELKGIWNFQDHRTVNVLDLPPPQQPIVIHFVTAAKPWNPRISSRYGKLYNYYRDKTMYSRSAMDVIKDVCIRCANGVERTVRESVLLVPLKKVVRSVGR